MKRLLEYDPETQSTETFEYDHSENRAVIHRRADVTSIIEDNKRRQNDGTNGYSKSRDWVHTAHIPVDICYLWLTKYGVRVWDKNHQPAVNRLLNSNEWRYLRISDIILKE